MVSLFKYDPYGWNHPGSISLLAECHQIMFEAELLSGTFFTKLPESICILSRKGSVRRIGKNIFKKVSQKVKFFCLLLDVKRSFFHFQNYTRSQKME